MAQPYNQFSPLNALAVVQQQGEMGRQRGQQNQLAKLAGQAYGATTPEQQQGLLTSMAVIDPAAAQSQQKQFQSDEDRRNRTLANMSQLLVNAPEQARAALYSRMVPELQRFGVDAPAQYDAQTAPIIDQTARAIYQAYSGAGAAASGVQSTYINRAGQRVAIMRDGSQQVLGEADSRTQLRDQEGVAPSIVDLRTGTATPLQAGVQQGASGAYRIDPSLPPEVQAAIRQAESSGTEYNGQTANPAVVATRPDSSMMITPYQQAQLVRQDRADSRADMAAMDARDARQQAAESRQIASQQKAQQAQQAITTRQAQLADVRRGVERVRSALSALDQSRIGTGPAAQLAQRYLPAGQELETAVNAMNNSMLALTRVPGVGAQSDLEARIASMRFPQLDRDESVNRQTLADLEKFVNDLSQTARRSDAQDQQIIQSGGGQAAGGSVQVRSAADYNALPSGATYIDPNGQRRRKP